MNLKKKLVALGMVFALALGMATSAFAGDVTTGTSGKRHIVNMSVGSYSYKYLNLEGSGSAYRNRNVTGYKYTSSADQIWQICDYGGGEKVYTTQTSTNGMRYTLNANVGTWNCNIYEDLPSNEDDALVRTVGMENNFTISLREHAGKYLNLQTSNRNVMWGSYQAWALA